MAHEIHSIAYVGAEPWHGLGNALPKNQPIEVWQQCAGMAFCRQCASSARLRGGFPSIRETGFRR